MSRVTRPKPTNMTVCDLCDKEIEPDEDGSYGRANLMVGYSPIVQVTDQTRHAILGWGRSRRRDREGRLERQYKSYDFHGHCIAELVQATIDAAPTEEADHG